MTDQEKSEREAELCARMEEEGYRVVPLSAVVDLACPPCFTECSNFDKLLAFCAETID